MTDDINEDQRRPLWLLVLILILGVFLTAGFIGLGVWQIDRLAWKRDLINRIDERVHAPAASIASLDSLSPGEREYRHVRVTGRFNHLAETQVKAVTELGDGFWILTPLRLNDGKTILINRGFVPKEYRNPASRSEGQIESQVTVIGLVRLSEPGGAFLRDNDPDSDRWFSRDIKAIAIAHDLSPVTDYFIDADNTSQPGGYPVGGLTVIHFRNTHLSYALTWFALAGLVASGIILIIRHELTLRKS